MFCFCVVDGESDFIAEENEEDDVGDSANREIDTETPAPGNGGEHATEDLVLDILWDESTGPMLYATANMSARKVFWVEFSRKELVSLIIILVITKQPAAG